MQNQRGSLYGPRPWSPRAPRSDKNKQRSKKSPPASAAAIGLTTFLCTAAGFFLTGRLHRFPTFHLEAGAGLILIGLGVKMLCDHLC